MLGQEQRRGHTGLRPPFRFCTWAGSCVKLCSSGSGEDSEKDSSSKCSTLGTGGTSSIVDIPTPQEYRYIERWSELADCVKVRYAQSAGSGMVPGHSLGQGTGVQRYGASECQMSLSLPAGEEGYKVVVRAKAISVG